jgi:hypothetical protein
MSENGFRMEIGQLNLPCFVGNPPKYSDKDQFKSDQKRSVSLNGLFAYPWFLLPWRCVAIEQGQRVLIRRRNKLQT